MHEEAYKSMYQGGSDFGPKSSPDELYFLAKLAFRVGKLEEAITLLNCALLKLPPDEPSPLLNEIKKTLAELDS